MEFLKKLLSTEYFMPHGHCYLWRTDILWLNVGSDFFIALAYFIIPFFLIKLVRLRRELRFNWIFILFALFITACGITHVIEILTVWKPIYGLQGLAKIVTAGASIATAASLYFLLPKALVFPSMEQLEEAHARLKQSFKEKELAEQRYKVILNSAMDAFIGVDGKGMITYCNRQTEALLGWDETEIIGKSFLDKVIPQRYHPARENFEEYFTKLSKKTENHSKLEMTVQVRNGREIPIDMSTTLFQWDEDFVFGFFLHNASERKQSERLQITQLEVTKALVDSDSIPEAFTRFIQIICSRMNWEFGAVWMDGIDSQDLSLQKVWHNQSEDLKVFEKRYRTLSRPIGSNILEKSREFSQSVQTLPIFKLAESKTFSALHLSIFSNYIQLKIALDAEHIGLIEFFSSNPLIDDSRARELLQDLTNRLELFVKRQQAEGQTRLSEARYRELVDSAKDYAIFLLDTGGHILSWNRGAEQIAGFKAQEVIGKHFSMFYPSEAIDAEVPIKDLEIARSVGKFEEESWRLRKDGSGYIANVIITPVFDSQERLQGYSQITRDITGRKLEEEKQQLLQKELKRQVQEQTEELRHSENQIRVITDALPDAVIYIDREYNVLFANDTYLSWQHTDRESVHGRNLIESFGKDAYEKLQVQLNPDHLKIKTSFELDLKFPDKNRLCHITCIPDINEVNHDLRGIINVMADITDQRSVEENLRIAKEAADTANAAKSAFLANMSHEIRTPLGAILGYSELLIGQGLSSSERFNYLGALKRNGDLLSNIINDVLDLSKVEAGKLDFERQEVPMEEILTDLTTLLHLQALEKGISLVVSSEGAIPSTIETDSLRLRQILMNIVGNALKFTSKGSINVVVKSIIVDHKQCLAFVIKDTGPGISEEQAAKLFRPFSQADVSTTRKFGGTGLGLTLSKKLAQGLGGDLVLTESRLGEGSTFTITIDPGQTSKVLFESSQPYLQRTTPTLTVVDAVRIDGFKVLLVEDSVDNQVVVQRYLRMAGCNADLADNGKEAIQKIQAQEYDVVLMDIQMPVMDGFEATAALRKMGYTLPIIALTAHALKEQRQQSLERGFSNHITKPVNRDNLINLIAQYGRRTKSDAKGG